MTQEIEPDRADESLLPISNWLRLVRIHNLILKDLRVRMKDQSGLTMPQFDVLAQLHRFGRGMTFVELSRQLLVTSGNLTGIVDRLTGLGLVIREPDVRDRRVIRVLLTAKGRMLVERLVPRHSADLKELLSALTTQDQKDLRRILGKLRDSL